MICKNCGEQTISKGKYCHTCGQPSDTHRLTFKHFVMHDIVHGLFHLDRGLPQTVKEILIRPGVVSLDYIRGKRKKYYNFFYLLLIIVGVYLFLRSVTPSGAEQQTMSANDGAKEFLTTIRNNRKLIIFALIPILGISSYLIFRRLRFTLLEFFIPAVVAVIGSNLFNILSYLVYIIQDKFQIKDTYSIIAVFDVFLGLSVTFFPLFVFAQLIKGYYTLLGKIWRLIAVYLLSLMIILLGTSILFIILTDGKGSFSYGVR